MDSQNKVGPYLRLTTWRLTQQTLVNGSTDIHAGISSYMAFFYCAIAQLDQSNMATLLHVGISVIIKQKIYG